MGSVGHEGHHHDESPQRRDRVSIGVGRFPITFDEWDAAIAAARTLPAPAGCCALSRREIAPRQNDPDVAQVDVRR
jgi:hypothetical protein